MNALLILLLLPIAALAGPDGAVEQGVVYRRVGAFTLAMDVFRPATASPSPAVVCVHGGAWSRGDRRSAAGIARDLAARGFVAAAVDFRQSQDARYPAAVEDVRAAVDWLGANAARFGVDPDKIGLFGISSGGHLALMVTTRPGARAVSACAVWSAPTDFVRGMTGGDAVPAGSLHAVERFLGGTFATHRALFEEASPARHATSATPPLWVAHGDRDGTVPFSQARYLAEAARPQGVEVTLVRVRGAGHGFGDRRSDPGRAVFEGTVAFFQRCLGTALR